MTPNLNRILWRALISVSAFLILKGNTTLAADWDAVDKMIAEDKLKSAEKAVEKILADSKDKSGEDWVRSLVKLATIRIEAGKYEKAVEGLKSQSWPKAPAERAVVELYYAQTLFAYLDAYSWEIKQREKTASTNKGDLKTWTTEQIYDEALRAYDNLWQARENLGSRKISEYGYYVRENTYPEGLRPTLRDLVTYKITEALQKTNLWSPAENSDLHKLDLATVLAEKSPSTGDVHVKDKSLHPVLRLAHVLKDLESWNASKGNRAGELEARLTLHSALHGIYPDDNNKIIIASLENYLKKHSEIPWAATGYGRLSGFYRDKDQLVTAHRIAADCVKKYKGTESSLCRHIKELIEQPSYQVTSMALDGLNERSIQVSYRNLHRIYFRAYISDLESVTMTSRDYSLLPDARDFGTLVKKKPTLTWSVELPATSDFKQHTAFITPPFKKKGFYTVVASGREDFSTKDNLLEGFSINISNLVMRTEAVAGGVSVTVLDGEKGQPVSQVAIGLYATNYKSGHKKVKEGLTDTKGQLTFAALNHNASYFLIAKKGTDTSLQSSPDIGWRREQSKFHQEVLLYTDRGAYRPNQTIKWKAVAYKKASSTGDLKIAPKATFDVILSDANYEQVKKVKVTTNEFGSASGEFVIPSGRLLGNWRIHTTHGSNEQWVSVEEYKRPTFEVSFKEIDSEIRLNSKAIIEGDAKYYFGAPVTDGKVAYKIERTPVYPRWMSFFFGRMDLNSVTQIVDSGTVKTKDDGSFSISFIPEAKKPENDFELGTTFHYQVSVDITDAGGETRSQATRLTAGHVTVQADLSTIETICFRGEDCALQVARQTLNGTAAPGSGQYEIRALNMPEKTLPMSELPVSDLGLSVDKSGEAVITPGDRQRPRWAGDYSPEAYLNAWPEGKSVAKGDIKHGKNGNGTISPGNLLPGPYKLLYSTKDSAGHAYKAWKFFIVAGTGPGLKIPAALATDTSSAEAGKKVRVFAHNGFDGLKTTVKLYHKTKLLREIALQPGSQTFEVAIEPGMRGGISLTMDVLQDFQTIRLSAPVYVPWDNKNLSISFERLREVMRPGTKETLTLKVKGANASERAAEILALMYDKSLDLIKPLQLTAPISLFPRTSDTPDVGFNLEATSGSYFLAEGFLSPPVPTYYSPDLLLDSDEINDSYGINLNKLGYGGGSVLAKRKMIGSAAEADMAMDMETAEGGMGNAPAAPLMAESAALAAQPENPTSGGKNPGETRENFAESAFFLPHLVTDQKGEVTATFTLPDSLTAWNVWVVGMMKDFSSGVAQKVVHTAKDLMVRLYSPRFFREGDDVAVSIVMTNMSKGDLAGALQVTVLDAESGRDVSKEWKLTLDRTQFSISPDGSVSVTAKAKVPPGIGSVKIRVSAKSGNITDAEIRAIPVLPGRMHLVQSRFAALSGKEKEILSFNDLKNSSDRSRINDKMVVTVDAQLFFSTLKALPYLIEYPYECTEQTLNRFLSAGIMSSLFAQSPDLAKAAAKFSNRTTQYAPWTDEDPNSRMLAEESPWLAAAGGGGRSPDEAALINLLKKETAKGVQSRALRKLEQSQTSSGGFPWFAGGPPSPYITLYLVYGFAKAQEFGIDLPKRMVANAWKYLARHYKELWSQKSKSKNADHSAFLIFLNYTASTFKDESLFEKSFSVDDRRRVLDDSFERWKTQSPYLKLMLALTMHRMNRQKDAKDILASVLDAVETSKETGTSWAPEDRSWLWFNDTVEMHAFALRTMSEIDIDSPLTTGIVHWLFMNKKLNQWKSTKATAEVIYALATWLKRTEGLASDEQVRINVGNLEKTLTFKKDEYVGRQYLEVQGQEVSPAMADVTLEKKSGGLVFASAAWHYSTEKLPEESRGDFFTIERKFFLRKAMGREITLTPIEKGAHVAVGDEVEVQISIKNKHQAEYVHLRDPRPAGFEPITLNSGYKWDLGISWYEEIRDSGTNFFFEWLPTGEYTFRYRLRAANAGTFKTMPAEIQSMYAPEFNAFSSGRTLVIQAQ